MDIRDIKAVLAAMDSGSFARAAEQLFVSRQALSQTVRKLEGELGIRFFDVADGNKLVPTAEGAVFAAQARPVTDAFDELARAYPAFGETDKSLTVSLATGVSLSLSEGFFSRFGERNARVVPEFEEGNTDSALALLDSGGADVAVVGTNPAMLDPQRYEVVLLVTTGLWVAVPTNNPLAQKERLSIADLDGQKFVTAGKLNHLHRYLVEKANAAKIHVEIPASSSNIEVLEHLVEEHNALCFAFPAAQGQAEGPIKIVPLDAPDAQGFGTYAVRRRESHRSPAARLFWTYLCEQSGALQRGRAKG